MQKFGLRDFFGPKKRTIVWSNDLTKFKWKYNKIYNVNDIIEVRDGQSTKNFMRFKKK